MSLFVFAQRNELGVPQVMLARPFQELDLRDQHRLATGSLYGAAQTVLLASALLFQRW